MCFVDLRGMRGHVRVPACVAVPAPTGFDPAAIPVVSGATMVITSKDGWVIAIDIRKVKMRWSVRTPVPILDSHPVVVGADVLLADWARVPWVLRLCDGTKLAVPGLDGSVIATAAGAAGRLRGGGAGWIGSGDRAVGAAPDLTREPGQFGPDARSRPRSGDGADRYTSTVPLSKPDQARPRTRGGVRLQMRPELSRTEDRTFREARLWPS